jgi:hypothetical protein
VATTTPPVQTTLPSAGAWPGRAGYTLTSARPLGATAVSYHNLPTRTQDGGRLHITMPTSAPFNALACVIKLTFSGQIPTQE